MKSIKNYSLLLVLFSIHLSVKLQAQVEIDSLPESYKITDYQLIYGNLGYDIDDFNLKNPDFPVLVSIGASGANFILLNKGHQKMSELFIASGTAKVNFWNDEQYYYYQPMLLYKSALCPISHKSGFVRFEVVENQLQFVDCKPLDQSYLGKEYFESTQNFKITYWDKEKKNPKKAEIGIAVNEKYYVRRRYHNTQERVSGVLFPYVQINRDLFFIDILEQDLYKISADNQLISKKKLQNNPFFADTLGNYWGYELLYDAFKNRIYLYGWSRQIQKSGRNTKINNQERKLWLLQENRLIEKLDLKHLSVKKIKIRNGFVYGSFGIKDEDLGGKERFMLYKSKFQLD